MSFNFAQPSSGNFFKPAERNGHLIIIVSVTEIGERFDNLAGRDKPFAVADIVDLDDPDGAALERGVTLSHVGIVNKLHTAHRTGEMVLGRIGQAPSSTNGNNPAWVLLPYTPGQDDARASAWLTANPISNFGQPAQQRPAPAPTPAATPQPAPMPVQQQYAPQPVQQSPHIQAMTAATAGIPNPVQAAYNAAQQQPAAPQPATPAPAAAPAMPAIDPNNLPPEVAALLAQLQGGQQPQQ